jgi:protoporphyrinogen oxidase
LQKNQRALIIGAGPAGLTAAYELIKRSHIMPIVLEKSHEMGGISRTVRYKGNRMDIGGHRFFSKSDRVMNWWLDMMPPEDTEGTETQITYQNRRRSVALHGDFRPDPEKHDRVMLVRNRRSRIYFLRKFFDYPITLSVDTLQKLGVIRTVKIGFSYAKAALWQIRPEKSLEDFLINRFGRQLYLTFFKSYTEKVWGVACGQISAEWGAQRIKGLSIAKAIGHILKKAFRSPAGLSQKEVETSLIERFFYPKLGPGQLWEYVADEVKTAGGEILTGYTVSKLFVEGNRIVAVSAVDDNGTETRFDADYIFSTMPIQELVRALDSPVPDQIRQISEGLVYRDFITVGMLLDRLRIKSDTDNGNRLLKDNWIYIQEPDVLVGRMQIFNNWSPYLVSDPSKVWVGLEYFCYETDDLWKKSDDEMAALAAEEMERIGVISKSDVLDTTVIRVPKTYPAYFGSYDHFPLLREYLDRFENLFLVGRNGMHKYNNQDHSMLTAMTAVDNILEGRIDKANIWAVNTEQEYHEAKKDAESRTAAPVSAAAS